VVRASYFRARQLVQFHCRTRTGACHFQCLPGSNDDPADLQACAFLALRALAGALSIAVQATSNDCLRLCARADRTWFFVVRRPQDFGSLTCALPCSRSSAPFLKREECRGSEYYRRARPACGNALMFSSRFLLMSLGAALGGWTSAHVGLSAAFVINALSFLALHIPCGLFRRVKLGSRRWKRLWLQVLKTSWRLLVGYSRRLGLHNSPRAGGHDSRYHCCGPPRRGSISSPIV